jgi:putative transposase
VHAAVDALGNPVEVQLSGGQEADCQHFDQLLDALPPAVKAVVGDKGYDTNAVLARIAEAGAEAVVPAKKNRCEAREIDENLYRDRNKVERFFLKIKQNRAVATRYDKTASSYLGVVELACIMCWLK